MRIFCAATVIALLAGPAYAQSQPPVPRYGEVDKEKSPQQKQEDRDTEKAYRKSLGNIPEQKATDPWGNVRSDSPPKAAVKDPPAKRAKAGSAAN
jgi:hypothetical protein